MITTKLWCPLELIYLTSHTASKWQGQDSHAILFAHCSCVLSLPQYCSNRDVQTTWDSRTPVREMLHIKLATVTATSGGPWMRRWPEFTKQCDFIRWPIQMVPDPLKLLICCPSETTKWKMYPCPEEWGLPQPRQCPRQCLCRPHSIWDTRAFTRVLPRKSPFWMYPSAFHGDRTHPKVATRKRVCLLTPSQLQQEKESLHLEYPLLSHTSFLVIPEQPTL